MIVVIDHDMRRELLDDLRQEYKLAEVREGTHLSSLTHCITKTYWDLTDGPAEIGDQTALFYAVGWGLERVLIPRKHVEPMVVDGITGTVDFMFADGTPADLKSTRKAVNGRKGEDGFQFPGEWLMRFKGYRYMLNVTQSQHRHDFGIAVLHLIPAELRTYRLLFSDAELEENWAQILARKDALHNMVNNEDPMPFQWNEEWECTNCERHLSCQLAASIKTLKEIADE